MSSTLLFGCLVAPVDSDDDGAPAYDRFGGSLGSSFTTLETEVVAPFIATTWGQRGGSSPNFTYNNKTPLVGVNANERAPVGCIAVAFGQALKYYNFPKRGIGSNAYCNSGGALYGCANEVEADFYREKYDWDSMPASLTGLSSPASVDAVSTLLYHIGVAVGVTYGLEGSAAKLANPATIKSFRKHFDMPAVAAQYRRDYSDEEWADLIVTEIRNRRPVVLVGFNGQVNAGHAYILDGLDTDGNVHVNWGWGGHLNGYFDLHNLKTPYGSFTEDLFALVNFAPELASAGQFCNGVRGRRCEPDLVCVSDASKTVIANTATSDDSGTCMNANDIDAANVLLPVTHTEAGMVDAETWHHLGMFQTQETIEVTLTGSGDADLYVRRNLQPGLGQDEFDCRPYKSGSHERCLLQGPGDYFISVHGYEASSFTVSITTQRVGE